MTKVTVRIPFVIEQYGYREFEVEADTLEEAIDELEDLDDAEELEGTQTKEVLHGSSGFPIYEWESVTIVDDN